MLQNMPERIDASILDKFDFGSSEAVKDKLLQDCFCDISPVKTFLQDNHSILVGAKGAGKTAVFTLVKSGYVSFDKVSKAKTVVISIDEPIEYATAASIIEKSLASNVADEAIRYQFLWEVYVLYRTCLALRSRGDLQALKDKFDVLCNLFSGEKPRLTLFQLLTSTKRTVGFKINMSNPAFPAPDFYFSAEPSTNTAAVDEQQITIDIESYKNDIEALLKKTGLTVYILIDNLDDFVAKDNHTVQRLILQGVLNCGRSYSRFPKLRLKISIRADLFYKLDFSQLGGYDKIMPDVVELLWNDADIRQFIARRLAFNLVATLKLKGIRVVVEKESLYLQPSERRQFKFMRFLLGLIGINRSGSQSDSSDARTINVRDQINRHVILTVFPREVLHRTDNGNKERHEVFSYLANHFDLGDGHTTPRIMLLFLKKLVLISAEYYRANPDERSLSRTAQNEFALFKRDHFLTAYAALQSDMLEIFKSCITLVEWRGRTDTLFAKKGRKISIKYPALCNMVGLDGTGVDAEDSKAYIAYLTHLGVLSCKNPKMTHKERIYELPLLLQFIWDNDR